MLLARGNLGHTLYSVYSLTNTQDWSTYNAFCLGDKLYIIDWENFNIAKSEAAESSLYALNKRMMKSW
jgi:serine/threonine-protein kinase RIO1